MSTKEWTETHPDVKVLMSTDNYAMKFMFKMVDASDSKNVSERVMDLRSLPLEQDELVLDDYLCSIYELLHQKIVMNRKEATA